MQVNQIQKFIDHVSPVPGYKIVVTFLNSTSFYGFFVQFGDWQGLKKNNKWRFVPVNKYSQFDNEFRKTNVPNPDYSIIIDGDVISNLEIICTYSIC